MLVADDSAVYRRLVEQALSSSEFLVLLAKSGLEAVKLFKEHHPQIVITDWVMPDITGIDLCRRIRASTEDPYTYVIILTSVSEKENVVEGLAAGADDYLTKPFDANELLARVGVGRRIIGLQQQVEAKNRLLEELAHTDALTGLPNRRALEDWASRQMSGAIRHGFSVWVALADLDLFKGVNDSFGHEAGDTVLKKFAEVLRNNTRRSNMCGRIGGEEFVFILTHVNAEQARIAADRIRQKFQEQTFQFGDQSLTVTVSIGVAGFGGECRPDFNGILRRADKALYSAKNGGRNRVEMDR